MTTAGCVSNAESAAGCVLQVARRSGPLAVRGLRIAAHEGTLSSIGEGPLPASRANIATDCSDRFPFGASDGGNLVATTPIDPDRPRWRGAPHAAGAAHRGQGPRHLAFRPNGPTIYLLHELDASIDVLATSPPPRTPPKHHRTTAAHRSTTPLHHTVAHEPFARHHGAARPAHGA